MIITLPKINNEVRVEDAIDALKKFGHQLYKTGGENLWITLSCSKKCNTEVLLDSLGYDIYEVKYYVYFTHRFTDRLENVNKDARAYCEKYRLLY